jgi:hypothetical protein
VETADVAMLSRIVVLKRATSSKEEAVKSGEPWQREEKSIAGTAEIKRQNHLITVAMSLSVSWFSVRNSWPFGDWPRGCRYDSTERATLVLSMKIHCSKISV